MRKFDIITVAAIVAKAMFAAVLLSGCVENKTSTVKREGEAQQRIYGKESTHYQGREYHIIEVDGVEYIASFGGGICPLVKNNQSAAGKMVDASPGRQSSSVDLPTTKIVYR